MHFALVLPTNAPLVVRLRQTALSAAAPDAAPVVPVCVCKLAWVVQVDIQSTEDVKELQDELGLALQLDTYGREGPPAPDLHVPCQAPFTSMLPDTMRLAHRCVYRCNQKTAGVHLMGCLKFGKTEIAIGMPDWMHTRDILHYP